MLPAKKARVPAVPYTAPTSAVLKPRPPTALASRRNSGPMVWICPSPARNRMMNRIASQMPGLAKKARMTSTRVAAIVARRRGAGRRRVARWPGSAHRWYSASAGQRRAQQAENRRPGRRHADALFQVAGQDHQPAQREEFGGVEKRALPAGIGGLLARRQAGDVQAVGGDVVGGGGQRHHREQRDGGGEPHRQLQRQRHPGQAAPPISWKPPPPLSCCAPVPGRDSTGLEHPGQAQQAGPACDLARSARPCS